MSDWEDAPGADDGWESASKEGSSLIGAGEAALNMVSTIPGALGGGLSYLGGLTSGDPELAMTLKQNFEKQANDLIEYEPRTKKGKKYQENIQKGFQTVIEAGGPAFENLTNTFLPQAGFDPEALQAIGRAGTEMALNVVDPLAPVVGLAAAARGRKGRVAEQAIREEAPASKLEALQSQWETADTQTMTTADDFGVINPYDVGGHVSASEQGRINTIDSAQGDLLGGQILEQSQATPQGGPLLDQVRYGGNEVPYDPVSLGDLPPQQAPHVLDVPSVPDRLELVPLGQETPPTPTGGGTPPTAPTGMALEAKPASEMTRYEKAQQKIAMQEEVVRKAIAADEARKAQKVHEQQVSDIEKAKKNGDLDYQYASDVIGDTSLMAMDATTNMRQSVAAGNAQLAMKSIADNHSNSSIRDLARYLAGKVEGLKVSMVDEGLIRMGDRDATGYFDPNTGDVVLSSVGANSPHTVMHEVVHGLTSQFIQGRPNDFRVRALDKAYRGMDLRDWPMVQNMREFIAEAFSNPEFQDFLKTQRVDNRTVWNKFTDFVKSVFGVRSNIETRLGSAFDNVIDLGKQVVEASDEPTRKSIMEQFQRGGLPNKLADLMATKPDPKNYETRKHEGLASLKVPGLTDPISDFKFYEKTPAGIAQMALDSPDIPNTMLEKASHQLQSGGLMASLKTRNPVVKYTFERISRAERAADRLVRENLSDAKTGLKSFMKRMDGVEKGEIHSAMMLNEGQRVMSTEQLRAAGYSDKQIAYHNRYRELNAQFFNQLNDVRAKIGLAPMDQRIAHVAGRFMGDFARMVFDEFGKVVGRISGNTKWELDRAYKFMAERHPEWKFGDQEYNAISKGHRAADRFQGLMEALNYVSKNDPNSAKLLEAYQDYMQQDAVNYLNATRHAKAKVREAGGVKGSEGNKPWKTLEANAEEGMKAQLSYFETGYKWMEMEKAVNDLKQVIGNEEVVQRQPNAIKYANQYVDHALHRNQGVIADAANWIASFIGEQTGVGHTNLFKASNVVKHRVLQKMMGFFNIPFSLAQLMQPIQANPAMAQLLKNRGLEFSQVKAGTAAMETYFNSLTNPKKLDKFEQDALRYANEMGIFDMKMADHVKDINSSKFGETFDKVADFNIQVPEHFTRGNTFLFYSHLLKDAGVPARDIFGAAENLTNFTMVDYRPIERPMGYAKLGWVGDVASALTRYKHNQLSQSAFYGREGVRSGNYSPLATYLAASLAFGGVMGFVGFQEADNLYQLFTEKVLKKPDSLVNQVLKSDMPEVMSHGLFSLLGIDMSSRFSNANLIPDNMVDAMMPYGSAIWDMIASTGRLVMDPTSETKQKQALKSIAPQSTQGLLENALFTDDNGLYVSSTDGPNFGKGRVRRTEEEQTKRGFGFRSIRESKELANNYANSQIEKANSNVVDRLLTKAKYAAMDDTLDAGTLQDLVSQAASLGEDPSTFVGKFITWGVDRQLSQKQQQLLRNAQRGFKGAYNMQQQGAVNGRN